MRGLLIEGFQGVIRCTRGHLSRQSPGDSCFTDTSASDLCAIQSAAYIAIRQISSSAFVRTKGKDDTAGS